MVAALNSRFFQHSSHARVVAIYRRWSAAEMKITVARDTWTGWSLIVSALQRWRERASKRETEGEREKGRVTREQRGVSYLGSRPGLLRDLRDPGLPGSAGGSPGGNTRTILWSPREISATHSRVRRRPQPRRNTLPCLLDCLLACFLACLVSRSTLPSLANWPTYLLLLRSVFFRSSCTKYLSLSGHREREKRSKLFFNSATFLRTFFI